MKQCNMKKNKSDFLGKVFLIFLFLFSICNMLEKDKLVSEQENRELTQKPVFTISGVINGTYMKQYESYVSDQFVGRNFLRQFNVFLKRVGGSREENEIYLGKHKQLMQKIVTPDQKLLEKNIKSINNFSRKYKNTKIKMLLVPDAAEVLKFELPELAVQKNQNNFMQDVKKKLSKRVQWIDAEPELKKHMDEKIYYKTDHHWTSLGAYYTFKSAAEKFDINGNILFEKYPVTEDFNGSLSSNSGFLAHETEEINVYIPKKNIDVVVNYVEEKKKRTSVYDVSKLSTKDKYAVFLGGNSSVIDIRTTASSDKKILIIKDSFANSFIPFLISGYREILVVDPRYYSGTINEIMDTYKISETLFLYSGNTFFQDGNISGVLQCK